MHCTSIARCFLALVGVKLARDPFTASVGWCSVLDATARCRLHVGVWSDGESGTQQFLGSLSFALSDIVGSGRQAQGPTARGSAHAQEAVPLLGRPTGDGVVSALTT